MIIAFTVESELISAHSKEDRSPSAMTGRAAEE
jgi:hypothetical protein